jgi:hypothetical protein
MTAAEEASKPARRRRRITKNQKKKLIDWFSPFLACQSSTRHAAIVCLKETRVRQSSLAPAGSFEWVRESFYRGFPTPAVSGSIDAHNPPTTTHSPRPLNMCDTFFSFSFQKSHAAALLIFHLFLLAGHS